MLTETEINAAHALKEQALRKVASALEEVVTTKAELETLNVHYTNLGLEGSNDKARAAYLAAKTEPEREAVAVAEARLRKVQLKLDLANNDLSCLRTLLQLLSFSPSE